MSVCATYEITSRAVIIILSVLYNTDRSSKRQQTFDNCLDISGLKQINGLELLLFWNSIGQYGLLKGLDVLHKGEITSFLVNPLDTSRGQYVDKAMKIMIQTQSFQTTSKKMISNVCNLQKIFSASYKQLKNHSLALVKKGVEDNRVSWR